MPKSVAVVGDVQATPSAKNYESYQGAWTPGAVSYKSYPKLSVGGTEVIYEASCTFSYYGTHTSGSGEVKEGKEEVILTSESTTLQGASHGVLLDGQSKKGDMENQLKVRASGKLRQ